jgi:type II secretory pathway pseudopilin PulG
MHRSQSQGGFSLLELLVVMGIMMILTATIMMLMNSSLKASTVTNEMTDAQQNLRTAQEMISRDLMAAGDGMQDIKAPRLPKSFMDSYLSSSTVKDSSNALLGVMGVLTSDDQVPTKTNLPLTSPVVKVLSSTDRFSIMQMDPTFNKGATIGLGSGAITSYGKFVTLPAGTDMTQFKVGDIYFFSSSKGAAFACVTTVDASTRLLTFATAGATLAAINQPDTDGPMNAVIAGGSSTMLRMLVINYFVDENNLLRKRVFGVGGGLGYTDTVVAEHVTDMQLRYILGSSDTKGNVTQPTTTLATETDQGSVRQVEVTLTTESAHAVVNGKKQSITVMAGTSIRNMQFNQALKPN